MARRLVLGILTVALAGCGAPPVFDIAPTCGGGYTVPQYRVSFLTFIGTLKIVVKDAQGNPVPDAKVNVQPKEFRKILCGPRPFYSVNAEGIRMVERVKTGTYTILYYKNGAESWETNGTYETRDVEVKANETTEVTFTKPAS
ncbi:hypothetical protein D3C72_649200 [compost metagenome]